MRRERLADGIERLASEVRFLRAALLGSIAVALLMLVRLLTAPTDIRMEVAAPPTVAKDFWVSTSGRATEAVSDPGGLRGASVRTGSEAGTLRSLPDVHDVLSESNLPVEKTLPHPGGR